MKQCDVVKSVKVKPASLILTYCTGITERFSYGKDGLLAIGREGAIFKNRIKISRQFTPPLGQTVDGFEHRLTIPRKAYDAATTIEQAIAIQDYLIRLLDCGYNCSYPKNVLEREWQSVLSTDPLQCFDKGIVRLHQHRGFPVLGRPIVEHFFDLGRYTSGKLSLNDAFKEPKLLYRAIRTVTGMKVPITSAAVSRHLGLGPRVYGPLCYVALLRKLDVKGPVIDYDPHLGIKAMACAALGIPYIPVGSDLDFACSRGFDGFIGLKYSEDPPQFGMIDGGFKTASLKKVMAISGPKYLMVFVPAEQRDEFLRWRAPAAQIMAAGSAIENRRDYFFVYKLR